MRYNKSLIRLSADFDFLTRNFRGQREWNDAFKVLKEKKGNCQPRILHLAKLSFNSEGEMKQKLMEFIITRPALKEIPKGVLENKMKEH